MYFRIPIMGYENLYDVDEVGNVYSLARWCNYTKKETILKQNTTTAGYKRVNLYKNNKVTSFKVHQLVAHHFIFNPDEKNIQVHHINQIKNDNRVENLQWVTHIENNQSKNKGISCNNTTGYKNINKNGNGYRFEIREYGVKYNKYFKTLDKAIKFKEDFLTGKINKDTCINSSGHKNITKDKNGYRFQILKNGMRHTKSFKTLDEAIAYKKTISS
tara:strand:- start:495 stop:1142 length:648 start_codon:yes stop_codon:yes gene_type:complete